MAAGSSSTRAWDSTPKCVRPSTCPGRPERRSPPRVCTTLRQTVLRIEESGARTDPRDPRPRTRRGVYYAFVSNSSPWTFLDERPVHTNPGTSFDTGLGVFAMTTTRVAASLRVVRQLLARHGEPESPHLIRIDDTPRVRQNRRGRSDFRRTVITWECERTSNSYPFRTYWT